MVSFSPRAPGGAPRELSNAAVGRHGRLCEAAVADAAEESYEGQRKAQLEWAAPAYAADKVVGDFEKLGDKEILEIARKNDLYEAP